MHNSLDWPVEASRQKESSSRWTQTGSNICLDFHGDPITAKLAVFSDGNHHMALQACLQEFLSRHTDVVDIFYATTPPGILVEYLNNQQLILGNLTLSRLPDVFISPPGIMDQLQAKGFISSHQAFIQSRGNVLLVRKDNPKNIQGIVDLLREDICLFISNPVTEKASFEVYRDTFLGLASEQGVDHSTVHSLLADSAANIEFGRGIHHREAPQCIFEGKADVAIVYYHLALRYCRIFPDYFDFIPLGGTKEDPRPSANNISTNYHIGLVGDGGDWGQQFLDFMLSDIASQLYAGHGLQHT